MGRDKGSLLLDGRSLLERAVELLREVGCDEVIVSGPGGVVDEVAGLGPLGGIASAHRKMAGHSFLVMPVDMPAMTASLLRRLVEAGAPSAFEEYELPAFLPGDERLTGALASSDLSVRGLLERLGARRLSIASGEEDCFANLNTPGEWERFRR
jgi:molybdopterin-guanine dinucleotide biosynthesis protein A